MRSPWNQAHFAHGETLNVTVEVTNTGSVAGEEIAQLYVRHRMPNRIRPIEMKGLVKHNLQPGETRKFLFTLRADDLLTSPAKDHTDAKLIFEGGDIDIFVGPNPRDVRSAHIFWERQAVISL